MRKYLEITTPDVNAPQPRANPKKGKAKGKSKSKGKVKNPRDAGRVEGWVA